MSTNETVLYPADIDQEVPSQQELVRRLLEGAFIVPSQSPHKGFDLAPAFMTTSELDVYERNDAAGVPFPAQGVRVATYDAPKIFTSSHIQYVEEVVSPDGTSWGDIELVQTYLGQLFEDSDACATDPVSDHEYLIRSLRFEVEQQRKSVPITISVVGFGRAEISIDGFRYRDECRLDLVAQIVGFPLEYCYLGG